MTTWFALKKSTPDVHRRDPRSFLDISHVLARAGVPGFRQALPRLAAEFGRARRYQHALTIALFGTDGFAPAGGVDPLATAGNGANGASAASAQIAPPGLLPAVLASVLRESTREEDVVTYAASLGRCIVAMPETDGAQAQQAVSRLRELGIRRLLCPVHASLAAFPQDGLTLEELIRQAEQEAVRSPLERVGSRVTSGAPVEC